MRKRRSNSGFSFLVTLTGCMFLFACVSPANATEISRQLSLKGYELSSRNIEVLRVAVKSGHSVQRILQHLHFAFRDASAGAYFSSPSHGSSSPHFFVFGRHIKPRLKTIFLSLQRKE
ncbi:MAG: hypothetical protein HY064_16265 [Bacteroidetes bacterium]|nr:hypothetical protein [Bacteroidota bacterium]